MGDVAALVGEERVVDGAVDDRRGRLERTLRIRRLDLERAVDDERRCGSPLPGRAVRGDGRRQGDEHPERDQLGRAGREESFHRSLLLGSWGVVRPYSTTALVASWAARSRGWAGAAPSGCSQQAANRPPASGTSGGSSSLQRSNAYGHRGWKRQPVGGRPGSGTSPGSASGRNPWPSGWGTAPINASL